MLSELEDGWQRCFVNSSERALQELSRHSYDVVVSDLRTAEVDGVALLTHVAKLHPRAVRLVLSGHNDEAAALELVQVAHQFLAKPCAAATLHQVITRTQQLKQLLPDSKLQSLIGQLGSLPSPANLQQERARLLGQEHTAETATALARLIEQDPAATAKLLQVASSAFFNSSASVADVEVAIMRLGLRTLRKLEPALTSVTLEHPSVLSLQQRSLEIAQLASQMVSLPEDASAAYIAGLLCDVGQLALLRLAPGRLGATQTEALHGDVTAQLTEPAAWGALHAEIGAYLLGLWGLPFQIVEAVANHHTPARGNGDGERLGLPQLVWLASCIVCGEEPAADLLQRFAAEDLYAKHRHRGAS